MNQLDYQPAFTSGAFPHNQALAPAPYAGLQQQPQQQNFHGAQHQQFLQAQQITAQDAAFHASPVQTTGPFSSTPQQQQQQQQHPSLRQSASPQQQNGPFNQQLKYPMAAPPLPQTPVSATQQFSPQHISTPTTPQSPGTDQRDAKRVQLLFEINHELFTEVSNLQAQGKGGAINPAMQAELRKANMDDSMAAEEYITTLRRLQANLSYLAYKGNLNSGAPPKNIPAGPAHMTPPPHMPQLQPKYDRLKELFPGWLGVEGRVGSAVQPTGNGSINGTSA